MIDHIVFSYPKAIVIDYLTRFYSSFNLDDRIEANLLIPCHAFTICKQNRLKIVSFSVIILSKLLLRQSLSYFRTVQTMSYGNRLYIEDENKFTNTCSSVYPNRQETKSIVSCSCYIQVQVCALPRR